MSPRDNAVNHHFQHICAVFFASMMLAIYLQHTLTGMQNRHWLDENAITAVFFICGFSSVVAWFLWLLRTRSENWELFDTTYRVLLLVSGVVGASLGRTYAG